MPTFFETPAQFRKWLVANHATAKELVVGFYKKGSGRASMTWPESVDQALCFGWIDGVRRSLGDDAYCIRFTPRKKASNWSKVNVGRVKELTRRKLMTPAGKRAFAERRADRTGIYSFERAEPAALSPDDEKKLRANARASKFFDAQAPSYRKVALHWVVSAKREETRARRLAQLIADSAAGRRLAHLSRPRKT